VGKWTAVARRRQPNGKKAHFLSSEWELVKRCGVLTAPFLEGDLIRELDLAGFVGDG
jgi:hypothetical protein